MLVLNFIFFIYYLYQVWITLMDYKVYRDVNYYYLFTQ